MKVLTKNLKELVARASTLEDKVAVLKDAYKGESCYILTAGPSINDLDKSRLKAFLKNKLVISIKQTIDILDGESDFHIINDFNYSAYKNISSNTIRAKLKTSNRLITPRYHPDLLFQIDRDMMNANIILAETLEFEKYKIDKNLYRPLGSGIMYELGIYLPVLLGVKEIYFIGWDIGNLSNDQIDRFYEKTGFIKKIERHLIQRFPFLYNKAYNRLRNLFHYFLFLVLKKNVTINVPGIRKSESKIIAESTRVLYEWLHKNGIQSYVVSNRSLCDKVIPRRKII